MISKKQDLLFASKQLCTVFIAARRHLMSQNSASAYTYPWSYPPRYSFAIRCIERCMDVKSEILDHVNVQTTLQMYVYPSTTSKRDAMETASMLAGIAKNFYFCKFGISS